VAFSCRCLGKANIGNAVLAVLCFASRTCLSMCLAPEVRPALVSSTLLGPSSMMASGCRASRLCCTQHLSGEYRCTCSSPNSIRLHRTSSLVLFSNPAVSLYSPFRPNFSLSFATPGPTIEMGGVCAAPAETWLAAHRKLFRPSKVTFACSKPGAGKATWKACTVQHSTVPLMDGWLMDQWGIGERPREATTPVITVAAGCCD
jgi:hypothetical protein